MGSTSLQPSTKDSTRPTEPMVPSSNPIHGPHPNHGSTHCPRCDSTHTKFCYYNNYSLSQPRYFCKSCRRYWTKGGTLRNIPVGGICRKNKKISSTSKKPTTTTHHRHPPPHHRCQDGSGISSNSVDLQLSYPDFMFESLTTDRFPATVADGGYGAGMGDTHGLAHETTAYDEHDGECYEAMMNGIDLKPRVFGLGWQDELAVCNSDLYGSGEGINGSSGYLMGFGSSWAGLMNEYGSSTTKPYLISFPSCCCKGRTSNGAHGGTCHRIDSLMKDPSSNTVSVAIYNQMRPQIVLFGDSITEQSFRYGGWGASLTDTYSRKADIVVRGYGGYNTRWALFLLNHIFPLSSTTPPVAATIFLGANDAALPGRTSERQYVPIEEYKENLRKIVRHLKECSPTMLIVLITPPPIDEEGRKEFATSLYGEKAMELPERTNEVTGTYANGCVEVAKEFGVASINLWSKMQETQGWQKKFLSDGLHLTPDGNGVVYEEVVRVFNGAWLSANEMPSDFPHHSEIDPHNPQTVFEQRCL